MDDYLEHTISSGNENGTITGDSGTIPKPSTALNVMAEEHLFLNEFLEMVKRRLDLDQRRSQELQNLRESWNPKWKESGVWSLISPFITYLDAEIQQLNLANEEMTTRLNAVQQSPSPARHTEGEFDPLTMPEFLEASYTECRHGYEGVKSVDSMRDFADWQDRTERGDEEGEEGYRPGVYVSETSHENHSLVLPQNDIRYRNAVAEQQRRVRFVVDWCKENYPVVLESHQNHAENTKALSQGFFSSQSALISGLTTACSVAVGSNKEFASTAFIGPRHESVKLESLHGLLRPGTYYNMIFGGERCPPLFGLCAEKAIPVINRLLDSSFRFTWHCDRESALGARDVYALEGGFKDQTEQIATTGEVSIPEEKGELFLKCLFACSPALIPLQKEHTDKHRFGVPRSKMMTLIEIIPQDNRKEILGVMLRLLTRLNEEASEPWKRAAEMLAHNKKAGHIIRDIWRKWDFEGNACLGPGMVRSWNAEEKRAEVTLKILHKRFLSLS